MSVQKSLLMIPGPIEVSPLVQEAFAVPPPGHLSAPVMKAFQRALGDMRRVWCAGDDAQPFILAGSGTIAMEAAVVNLVDPGERVLVVNTGYFSDRMAEMLQRRGAAVEQIRAAPGQSVDPEEVGRKMDEGGFRAVFATHVDTSTGVRVDAKGIAEVASASGALSIFDGVCATAAEAFRMEKWGADVYLTASQKAIGLPAGLALMVVSKKALLIRRGIGQAPPMSMDFEAWLPIMQAYEEGKPSYFSTPATNLILALSASLEEMMQEKWRGREGMEARFARHRHVAMAMREAWSAMGLSLLPEEEHAAFSMSALRYPEGVDASLVAAIKKRGVVVAGGLYPGLKHTYFRVGHMGYSVTQDAHLERAVNAVEKALVEKGHPVREGAGGDALREALGRV